jgi:hypothetical protein
MGLIYSPSRHFAPIQAVQLEKCRAYELPVRL